MSGAPMVEKPCFSPACDGKTTWHNPLKTVGNKQPDYRCTQCGFPRRMGHAHVAKVGGKVMWYGKA